MIFMKKNILIFLPVMIFAGCSHLNSQTKIALDTNKLISFEEARKDSSTAKSPALYKFEKEGKKLWYLASRHTVDSNSETFRFINQVFATQKIDVVIVEGFETQLGPNPKSIISYLEKEKKKGVYSNGEPSFVVEKALEKNVPFIGGEPSEKEIFRAALNQGFTEKDIIGFAFVRRMPQLRRAGALRNMADLEKEFKSYSYSRAKDLEFKDFQYSFLDFKQWYQEKQKKELSLDSGEKGEAAPMEGPFFTQKISLMVTRLRDEHLLNTISRLMNENESVFIVYGSSHYRIEHLALKSTLGLPIEVALLSDD